MEFLRTRKLLPLMPEHEPAAAAMVPQSGISSNTSSAFVEHPSPSFNVSHRNEHRTHEDYSYYSGGSTSSSYGGFSSYRLNPPFDSSMAVTILVLLTALFSMGFFSIYIRRFADDSSVDPSRFRRFRRRSASRPPNLSSRSAAKGVDPETVDSLPVYRYDGGAKPELECAICLGEFQEGECVKVIPFCGHMFHADCIVMWLASHVTCPLCRTAKLLPEEKAAEKEENRVAPLEVRVSIGCDAGGAESVGGSTSTVDGRDTWRENGGVGPSRPGRSGSCSWTSVERAMLRRSMSF